MKHKNLFQFVFVVVFVLILAIVSYFFIRGDYAKQDNTAIQFETALNLDDKSLAENSQEQVTPVIEVVTLSEDFTPTPYRGYYHFGDCGISINHFETKVQKAKKERYIKSKRKNSKISAELSELQLQAIQGVRAKCQQWYDFLATMNETALTEYKEKAKESKKLESYFNEDNDVSHEDKLATARDLVVSGEFDDSWFSAAALGYLLKRDYQFFQKISEKLNVKGTQYLNGNIFNIVALYNCSINFERDCAANSQNMMEMCYSFPEGDMCGISYNQYIAATTTANNYMDLENIVSIIRQLIKQGYFD